MPRVLKAILKCQDYPGEITPTIFKSRENIIENFFYSKVHKIFIDNIRKQIFFEKYRNFPIVDPESEDYLFLFHSSRNIPLQLAEYNINRIVQAVQNWKEHCLPSHLHTKEELSQIKDDWTALIKQAVIDIQENSNITSSFNGIRSLRNSFKFVSEKCEENEFLTVIASSELLISTFGFQAAIKTFPIIFFYPSMYQFLSNSLYLAFDKLLTVPSSLSIR